MTHANLVAKVFGSANGSWDPWQPEDVSLVAMPIAHIIGTGWGCLGCDFGASKALEHIECDHITQMFAVPAAIERMLREATEVFQSDSCQPYGRTETTGAITCLPAQDHDIGGNARMRSAGKPLGRTFSLHQVTPALKHGRQFAIAVDHAAALAQRLSDASIYATCRDGRLRIAPSIFSTHADIEAVCIVLAVAKHRSFRRESLELDISASASAGRSHFAQAVRVMFSTRMHQQ